MFKINYRSFWNRLVGSTEAFPMERRAFHFVSLTTLAILLLLLPFNLFIGLYDIALMMVGAIILQALFYYLSRFGRRYYSSIIIAYAIAVYAIMGLTFYYNAGIDGPPILLFFLTFHLLVVFTPKKQHIIWALCHLCIATGLLLYQYFHPLAVSNVYTTKSDRYVDIISTYVVSLVFIYVITIYLRNSYNKERNSATRKAIRIKRQHTDLELLNQQKDKLFSIIAHDLRSPLNSIQGYLELVPSKMFDEQEREKFEQELADLTRNTTDMLSNLLIWTKSQLEGQKVHLQPLQVADALHGELLVQAAIAGKKGIEASFSVAPAIVMADPDMLRLVVRNLFNNAIKFTRPGGTVKVQGNEMLGGYRISVTDTGIGIPAAKQADIFTLKLQSSFGTSNEKGVGLGLYLCKEYTELQNGSIGFDTDEGKGSVFYVVLPLVN